jgi:hypothetical protein
LDSPGLLSLLERQERSVAVKVKRDRPFIGYSFARQQGKYAALHARMMALKGNIDDDAVTKVAEASSIDLAKLKRDMTAASAARSSSAITRWLTRSASMQCRRW